MPQYALELKAPLTMSEFLQFPGSSSPERQRLCAEDSLASPGTHSAKTCTKCRSVLPLGEFYINSCNGQRVSQCKSCCRAKAIERRELKLEHCRNQERLRALTKSRRVGAARDSAKERAHKVVQRLINSGGLKRKPCVVCGRTPAQAHHEDYSKPECVHWLCCMHHQQIHAGRFSIISRPDVGTGARVKISRI